jgi:hypothetical protein
MPIVDHRQEKDRLTAMLLIVQILNVILIFAAGILLASRIYPTLFRSSDVTGHDYIKDL